MQYAVQYSSSVSIYIWPFFYFLLQYADGVAIVFDLSRPETFEGALSWLSDVTQKLFDEKRELAAAKVASAATPRLNYSAEDSLEANKVFGTFQL